MTVLEEQKLQTEINKMIKETSHISFKERLMYIGLWMTAGAGVIKFIEVIS